MEDSKIISLAMDGGADYAEIRYGSKRGTLMEIQGDEVKSASYGEDSGASVRVLYGGAWGFYSTSDLTDSGLKQAVETALKLAKVSAAGVKEKAVLADVPPATGKEIWAPKKNAMDIPIEDKRDLLLDIAKAVKEVEKIHSITTGYGDSIEMQHVVNSQGTDIYTEVSRTYARARIIARDGGDIVGFVASAGGTGGYEVFDLSDPIEHFVESARSAARILTAEPTPSGKFPVVTDPDLTGVFAHEALGHATEADLVQSGSSCLAGKIGEKIGNDIVTIVDDPTLPNIYGSFPYDAEGVRAKRKVLVDKGVLRSYIVNRETAARYGIEPNGGARAESYAHRPIVRMSNTFIENGDHSFEELIEDIKYGIYAKGSRGGQVDTTRGSFQFSAEEAFLIENGEVTRPLKDVSLSGMTLEILKMIDAVGNDLRLSSPGNCGKGQWVPVSDGGPHVRIQGAVIGGGQ